MSLNEERKIKEKFNHKTWNEIKTNDSWAIFKIMAEFVAGYEKLSKIGPCVSIFGSARLKPGHKYYDLAESIAFKFIVIPSLSPSSPSRVGRAYKVSRGLSTIKRSVISFFKISSILAGA